MTYNVAPGTLTQQPQRPVRVSKASGLAHGIGEVIVPHLGVSLVRRLPYTVRGTGVRHIPTPAGVAVGLTAFTNNGNVYPLNWPHHGFRLSPPFTIGCLGYINSSSGVALGDVYTSNNSGWRIRASGLQIIADVTRGGATVTVTDPSTITQGTVHAIMLVVTASTLTLYVDGVQVATGSHSSYSAGNLTSVGVVGQLAGGSFNAGGVLQLTSWTRALVAEDAMCWAEQPWSILEDEDDVWTSSAGGSTITATTSLSAAIQIAANATASIDAAIQTSHTASASLDVAVQRALTATASIDAAIQAAQAATASIDAAVQASQSASASVDTAVQQAHTATAGVDTAVQAAGTATSAIDVAVQAQGTASASLDAYVQAPQNVTAAFDVAIQAAQTIAASIDTVVQLANTTTASLDTAIQAAAMATASMNTYVQADGTVSAALNVAIQAEQSTSAGLDVAVQLARSAAASLDTVVALGQSATASLNAFIQAESLATASLDAAILAAVSASASMDAAVQDARGAQIGLNAAIAVRQMLSAAMDVAVQASRTGVLSLSAYIYDPDAVNLRDFMSDISSFAAPPGDPSAITSGEQLSAVMLGSPIRVHPR